MECKAIPKSVHQLSILITDDVEIRALNSFYRKKRKATDVLSFSQLEGSQKGMNPSSLGDVVISFERAAAQAKRYRVTFSREMLRLLVHGILHLFGYDHVNVPRSRALEMRAVESRLVKRFSPKLVLEK